MILKILLVIGVIGIIYFMFIKKKPTITSQDESPKKADANDMVECAECGVYTQLSESIMSNGKYYCSKECLQKAS